MVQDQTIDSCLELSQQKALGGNPHDPESQQTRHSHGKFAAEKNRQDHRRSRSNWLHSDGRWR